MGGSMVEDMKALQVMSEVLSLLKEHGGDMGQAYWIAVLGGHMSTLYEGICEKQKRLDPLSCVREETRRDAREHGISDEDLAETAREGLRRISRDLQLAWETGCRTARMGAAVATGLGINPFTAQIGIAFAPKHDGSLNDALRDVVNSDEGLRAASDMIQTVRKNFPVDPEADRVVEEWFAEREQSRPKKKRKIRRKRERKVAVADTTLKDAADVVQRILRAIGEEGTREAAFDVVSGMVGDLGAEKTQLALDVMRETLDNAAALEAMFDQYRDKPEGDAQ